jgi:hypothetical protein
VLQSSRPCVAQNSLRGTRGSGGRRWSWRWRRRQRTGRGPRRRRRRRRTRRRIRGRPPRHMGGRVAHKRVCAFMKQQGWAGWKRLFGAWAGATADGSLPALATAARCGGDRAAHFCGGIRMKLAAATLPFAGPDVHVARAAASTGASHQSHHEEEPRVTRGADEAANEKGQRGWVAQRVRVGCEMVRSMSSCSLYTTHLR